MWSESLYASAVLPGSAAMSIAALLCARRRASELHAARSELSARNTEAAAVLDRLAIVDGQLAAAQQDAERLAERASRLQRLATELSGAVTPTDVSRIVLDLGLGVLEARRGFFGAVTSGRLEIIDTNGYDSDMRDRVMHVTMENDIPLTRAVKARTPVYLESVEEYRREYPWAFERFGAVSDSQAHVAIPLISQNRVLGGVGFSFVAPTAFGSADRAFTILLAEMAAAALGRACEFASEREQRRNAEAMSRARGEVLATVAHDLRNPLNLINGAAQIILDLDPDSDKRRQLLGACVRAVRQMNRLIGDLLDLTRLESGKFSLELEKVNVQSIVQQLDEMFTSKAVEQRITLRTLVPNDNLFVLADSSRLLQALGNVVSNALKFTPEGGSVTLCAMPERGGGVEFRVEDTGPGIPAENLPHLFDRFWQARNDHRGIGLGLAIVKGIAEAHGGNVGVETIVGQGTTFTFSLPCAEVRNAQRQVA